ncbi:hypothetical protein ELI07_32765 (plasmid) [Rhizobium leguminosarum]|uniref:hypothetical protein n=1 Tax=Rhizobium leguminosarum TaxID=384 RepID=UPI00102F75F7|nr:hypothetical protein [Rhizobium leguminosarum]TAX01964.1 hypothetical protein ELI07_32765 [Rhizobium leguminosarum]TAZ03232.1 hypothetical protein ELH81_30920 [Rhizobium leguminosarum]
MTEVVDQLPRIFQANPDRLFVRVIQPNMDALVFHNVLEEGEAASMHEFLDRAATQVDNYTANEAAKSFVLTLAAVFERQLSIWATSTRTKDLAKLRGFQEYLQACAQHGNVDLATDDLGAELDEMFTVANVVRHGEGPSCERLRTMAPALWDHTIAEYRDLLPGPSRPSETLRLRRTDLVRYIRATTRFWGRADPLPMAVIDPPYWLT